MFNFYRRIMQFVRTVLLYKNQWQALLTLAGLFYLPVLILIELAYGCVKLTYLVSVTGVEIMTITYTDWVTAEEAIWQATTSNLVIELLLLVLLILTAKVIIRNRRYACRCWSLLLLLTGAKILLGVNKYHLLVFGWIFWETFHWLAYIPLVLITLGVVIFWLRPRYPWILDVIIIIAIPTTLIITNIVLMMFLIWLGNDSPIETSIIWTVLLGMSILQIITQLKYQLDTKLRWLYISLIISMEPYKLLLLATALDPSWTEAHRLLLLLQNRAFNEVILFCNICVLLHLNLEFLKEGEIPPPKRKEWMSDLAFEQATKAKKESVREMIGYAGILDILYMIGLFISPLIWYEDRILTAILPSHARMHAIILADQLVQYVIAMLVPLFLFSMLLPTIVQNKIKGYLEETGNMITLPEFQITILVVLSWLTDKLPL